MYKSTLFSELLKLIPRNFVQDAAHEFHGDSGRTTFKTWHYLTAMLYLHFSGVTSLRTLEQSLGSHHSSLYHLGKMHLKRSTLSDANQTRKASVFESIFQQMLKLIPKQHLKRKGFPLKLLDASCITVKGRGSQWTQATSTRCGHGVKMHIGLEYESSHLWFGTTSETNVNDVTIGKTIPISSGEIYVMDKAYCDYNWWADIHQQNAYFVTRLKQNAAYQVVAEHTDKSGLKSQTILLANKFHSRGKKNRYVGIPLRLVHVPHPSKPKKHLAVVSNATHLSAEDIAQIYKKRWDIELFFKFLKQNTRLRKFIGESKNAVLIQIYTALIAYVLLMLYRRLSRPKKTLFEVLTFIKAHLMNLVERIIPPPKQFPFSRQKCLIFGG